MALTRFARPATAPAINPVAALPPPETPVTAQTTFDPDTSYRVQLNGIAEYLGTPLSPMHVHEVTGTVATAIRAKIAAYAPV